MARISRHLTAGTLLGLAGLHAAWGSGRAIPFTDQATLTEAVVGSRRMPSPASCFAVATALVAAAGLVELSPTVPVARVGALGVATVLGVRGTLGLAGRTDLVSPGSTSTRFRRLDRRLYSPLCLALSAGALEAAFADRGRRPGAG